MEEWKAKILEVLLGIIITHNGTVNTAFDSTSLNSCADLMYRVWYHSVYPGVGWSDYTENYKKYMNRTNVALKQLIKEDKIEILDEKTKRGGKIYKYKQKTIKFKFNINKYATTSDN